MRSVVAFLGLALAGLGIGAVCNQSGSRHKSEVEITRMIPEQHVEEYCNEYVRHGLRDREYLDLLDGHITKDGLRAVPAMVKIINEFDPKIGGRDKEDASYQAELLLGSLDSGSVRLRGFEDGRVAIDAVSRAIERMHAAHYDTAPDEGERSKRLRYEIAANTLRELQSTNNYDRAVQDTLDLRYKIKLSDVELLDFANYLISQDPRYPSWSELDWYTDHNRINDAGNPAQYSIVQNIDPFYTAYLKSKAKR